MCNRKTLITWVHTDKYTWKIKILRNTKSACKSILSFNRSSLGQRRHTLETSEEAGENKSNHEKHKLIKRKIVKETKNTNNKYKDKELISTTKKTTQHKEKQQKNNKT